MFPLETGVSEATTNPRRTELNANGNNGANSAKWLNGENGAKDANFVSSTPGQDLGPDQSPQPWSALADSSTAVDVGVGKDLVRSREKDTEGRYAARDNPDSGDQYPM